MVGFPKGCKGAPEGWQFVFAAGARLANIGRMNGGKIDFLRVRRRFRRPLLTGRGPVEAVDRLLLRAETAEGVGYGEVAPWPGFPTETIEQAVEVIRSAQGNLGRLRAVAEAAGEALPCLRAALSSCAHWTEIAGFTGHLACAGLAERATSAAVGAKVTEGFATVKVKLDAAIRPDDVRGILTSVPAVRLRLDANGGLDLAAARVDGLRPRRAAGRLPRATAARRPSGLRLARRRPGRPRRILPHARRRRLGRPGGGEAVARGRLGCLPRLARGAPWVGRLLFRLRDGHRSTSRALARRAGSGGGHRGLRHVGPL